jgi:D-arabinose 1-dehydrogenase-like Zn-dependent alcohol dehydrogenase
VLTAQITVFGGLRAAETKSTDRVGIIGMGGLGHLAVMYARAMGCDVTVFSSREDKKADAIALGATEFCLLNTKDQSGVGSGNINVMILCGGSVSDLGLYIAALYLIDLR